MVRWGREKCIDVVVVTFATSAQEMSLFTNSLMSTCNILTLKRRKHFLHVCTLSTRC